MKMAAFTALTQGFCKMPRAVFILFQWSVAVQSRIAGNIFVPLIVVEVGYCSKFDMSARNRLWGGNYHMDEIMLHEKCSEITWEFQL
jgi:hypothetical protein